MPDTTGICPPPQIELNTDQIGPSLATPVAKA
jgi:hypothetical protein